MPKKVCNCAGRAATPMFASKENTIFVPYPNISGIQLTTEEPIDFKEMLSVAVTLTIMLTSNPDLTVLILN